MRTVHGVYCLFATTALAYTYESITAFNDGNIIIAKQISHNWLAHSPRGESQRGASQDVLLKQQQLLQSCQGCVLSMAFLMGNEHNVNEFVYEWIFVLSW